MKFTVYKDASGEFRWRLQADNNRTIADSGEGYGNEADAIHAIDLFRREAPDAKVVDAEGKDVSIPDA